MADEIPAKRKGKQVKKKAEGVSADSHDGVPPEYVAFAKATTDPYSFSPGGPLREANQSRLVDVIKSLKSSQLEPLRSAAKHIDDRLADVEKMAREFQSRDENYDTLIQRIKEKAEKGGYISEVLREHTNYNRFGSQTTQWLEARDDGPMFVWSASVGLEFARQEHKKIVAIAYHNAVQWGAQKAWNEIAAKGDLIYEDSRQLPNVVEVVMQPPVPEKRSPECIKVVNRSGQVLKHATLTVELQHFHRYLPIGKFFIDNWMPGQGIYFLLPGYFPNQEESGFVSTLGPEFSSLAGCGGIIEAKTRLMAVGIKQPTRIQTFPKQVTESADWDLKNITRLLATLEDESRIVKKGRSVVKDETEKQVDKIRSWVNTHLDRLQAKYPNDPSYAAKIKNAKNERKKFVTAQTLLFNEELDRLTRPQSGFAGIWRRVADVQYLNRVTTDEQWKRVVAEQAEVVGKTGNVEMRVEGHNQATGTIAVILFDPASHSKRIRYVGRLESRPWDPHGEHSLRLRPEAVPPTTLAEPTLFDNHGELVLRPSAGRWLGYLPNLSRGEQSIGVGWLLEFSPTETSAADSPLKKKEIAEEARQLSELMELFSKGSVQQGVWRIETDAQLLKELNREKLNQIVHNATQEGTYKIHVLDSDPGTREITARFEWNGVSARPPAAGKLAKKVQLNQEAAKKDAQGIRPARIGRIVKDEKSGVWQIRFPLPDDSEGLKAASSLDNLKSTDVNPAYAPGLIVFEMKKNGLVGKRVIPNARGAVWIALQPDKQMKDR